MDRRYTSHIRVTGEVWLGLCGWSCCRRGRLHVHDEQRDREQFPWPKLWPTRTQKLLVCSMQPGSPTDLFFLFSSSPLVPLPRARPCLAGFSVPGIDRLRPNIYFRIRTRREGTMETFLESSRQPDFNRRPPGRRGDAMESVPISATFPLDHAAPSAIGLLQGLQSRKL